MRLTASQRKIVKRIKRDLNNWGISLYVRRGYNVLADGDKCSGYFDPAGRRIVLSSQKDPVSFFAILFHEYGHFLQWRGAINGERSVCAKAWIDFVELPHMRKDRKLWKSYKALVACELNAELTAFRLLKKYNIGTKEERLALTKAAALYLYCHRLMYDKGRWFKEGSGDLTQWLQDEAIWDALPSTLRGVNFVRIPKDLRKLLLKRF